MLNRRAIMFLFACVPFLAAAPVKADTAADAQAYVQRLADTAVTTVATRTISDDERAKRFRAMFLENFDLPEIGKLVLGRFWKVATPDQQTEFVRLFEDIQVLTWAKRFKDYAGEGVEVLGAATEGDGDMMVESRIKRDKLDPVSVGWRVRKGAERMRVLDIKVEGASMALTHRSEYSAVIQSGGGQVEALLTAMRKKLAQLQGETAKAN